MTPMTLYYHQDRGPAFGRYGSLPSVCDSTALDEITLYSDLLQAVAAQPTGTKRLGWDVIDRALGVTRADGGKAAGKGKAQPESN